MLILKQKLNPSILGRILQKTQKQGLEFQYCEHTSRVEKKWSRKGKQQRNHIFWGTVGDHIIYTSESTQMVQQKLSCLYPTINHTKDRVKGVKGVTLKDLWNMNLAALHDHLSIKY